MFMLHEKPNELEVLDNGKASLLERANKQINLLKWHFVERVTGVSKGDISHTLRVSHTYACCVSLKRP